MEVDLRTDGSIKNSGIVSLSGHSQAIMVPGELVLSNNQEQEAYKCEHFSIRGYVAEVRKREMKLCWPLFKIHDCRSDEQPNLAPPLFVKKFRRWNCQNCLQEISDPETAIENGIALNIQNDLVKSDYPSSTGTTTVESQPPTIKTIASLPNQSEERVVERESFIPGSNGECLPLICCGQQVNDLQSSDFIKEGISIPRSGHDKCHKYKKCMSPTIIVATEGEAFQGGNITVRSNRSEDAILGKQKFDIVLPSKRKDTELVHGVGDAEISNKVIASTSFNAPLPDQKDDHGINETMKIKDLCRNVVKDIWMPRKDNTIQPSHHDRDRHEETDADMDLVHTQDDVMNPAVSVDRLQNKRAPKLRSLHDIFRSDEIRKAEKVGISSGGAGTNSNDNDKKKSMGRGNSGVNGNYNVKSDKSKSEVETPNCRSDLVTQKAESKPNRKRTIPSDGEGPCLVHWLKRLPRKAKSHKGDAQGKHIDTDVGKCKSVVVRDLDLNREYCGEEDEQEIVGEKSNLMTDVEIMRPPCMPKEDELPLKGYMITQHQPACASHSTNPHSKLSVVTKSKDLHQGRKTQERVDKKISLSNKKNKMPQTEDGILSRTQCLKRNGFQLHEKGTKKQTTTWTSEQPDEDDIPMDIVELLARHRHERHLMNGMTDIGSTHNLPVMTEGIKDDNRCSMADYRSNHNLEMMTGTTKDVNMWGIGGAHGKKVSDETHWRISPEESQSNFKEYNYPVRNDRKVECGPESYHSYSMSKQNHHIDLNQEAPISASIGFPAFSPYIGLSVSADQPPNRNFFPQNVSRDRMEMLALCSDHMNHTTPGHNSSSFIHDGSSVLLNGTPAFRNFDLNFNCNDLHPRGTPKAVAHNAGYQMMLDLSGKHLLIYKAKDESSISEGRTSATKPCAVSVNGHNSKMMDPAELDTNETISALNLLRLMDQAACSGEPRCSSIHSIRSAQLGQGNELLQSEVGIRSSESAKFPILVHKADHGQQPRNSGIPIRPVARVGVLGPLLQKEIATNSSNSKPSFGFQVSSEQSSLKTNAMGKGEAFHSATATATKTMNAQTSISRDVSSKEVGYSVGSLENTGCSVAGSSIVQHATNNKNETLQPVVSTCKMEVCLLNRNPADFAMVDEDSEYMIGYKEHRRKYTPRSKNLQPPSNLKGKKRQRVMKVNNLRG
ncbi:protein EMBRYONIC FLOWER 1 isoform X1 [Iris pallida]|uniref:Protein EMBRYONIC FLOWER 1 isoform X1 n=1 Tax=Iris pallida TaxID=29817 RepID=A0AAX6G450_IRIPA|nr:protein EMBRYONIC FLOWER 1 isoform X1 [Iris pallida]